MELKECHVAIVGGGIAGLYTAYRLRQMWIDAEGRKTLEKRFDVKKGERFRIVILEENPLELGGRVRAVRLPFPGGSAIAEVGPMRFTTRQELLRRLLHDLGIKTVPFKGEGFDKSYFLRGKHFRDDDLKKNDSPYKLVDIPKRREKGKGPDDLVEMAFDDALEELSLDSKLLLNPETPPEELPKALLVLERLRDKTLRTKLKKADWDLIHKYGLLLGRVRPKDIGVWNLIHHYLSPEGAKLVEDGFGYESVIGNWNLSDAIPWFIADFGPGQSYESVVGSFGELISGLKSLLVQSKEIECKIVQNIRVRKLEIDAGGKRYKVTGTTTSLLYKNSDRLALAPKTDKTDRMKWNELKATAVVLAIPREPLLNLDVEALLEKGRPAFKANERKWRAMLHKVRAHRLAKLVQGYRNPWWRTPGTPDGAGSLIITDLPLRQVYYWDETWLGKRGRYEYYDDEGKIIPDHTGRQPGIRGIVVAYLDGHYTSYWRFITTVQRLRATDSDAREDESEFGPKHAAEMEESRCECFGERIWGWPDPPEFSPRKWSADKQGAERFYARPVDQWSDEERARCLYFSKHGLFDRASLKMTHILRDLHGSLNDGTAGKVEDPVAGAYTFWDDFGDEPIPEAGWHTWEPGVDSEACMDYMTQPFGKNDVYVCGEAFSSEQGWIEGALKSVERMMHRFGVDLDQEIYEHIGSPQSPVSKGGKSKGSNRVGRDAR